jgi:hypothetical protein
MLVITNRRQPAMLAQRLLHSPKLHSTIYEAGIRL